MISRLQTWITIIGTLLICVIGTVIRYHYARQDALWLDELHTSWVIDAGWSDVAFRSAIGNQNPLFFLLTWLAAQLLEPSEFQVRLVAFIVGVATVGLASWLTWHWTRSRLATIFATVAVNFDPQLIYYGSEARPYGCLHFLGLLHVYFFFRWLKDLDDHANKQSGKSNLGSILLLALTTLLLVYTHITCLWLFIAEFVFLLSYPSVLWRKVVVKQLPLGSMFVATLAAPLLVQLTLVFKRRGNWESVSSFSSLTWEVAPDFLFFLVIPIFFWGLQAFSESVRATSPQEAIPANFENPNIRFCLIWALIPVALVGLAQICEVPMALRRYIQIGHVAPIVGASLILSRLDHRWKRILIAVGIILLTTLINPYWRAALERGKLPEIRMERWDLVVQETHRLARKYPARPIFLLGNIIEDVDALKNRNGRFQEYLLFPVSGLYPLVGQVYQVHPRPTIANTHFTRHDIRKSWQAGGCLIVIRGRRQLVHDVADQVRRLTMAIYQIEPVVELYEPEISDVVLLHVKF